MIIPIRLYGDECLKEVAFDVDLEQGDNVVELVTDLFDTLRVSGSGVGLASTQIGVPLRVFVLIYEDYQSEFINPEILESGDVKDVDEEGCLSIPNVGVDVERYESIRLKYFVLGENGELIEIIEEFDGYLARIIQHEIDHLDGICITDKVMGLAKRVLQPKLKKILQGRTEYRYPTLHRKNKNYAKIADEIYSKYIKE